MSLNPFHDDSTRPPEGALSSPHLSRYCMSSACASDSLLAKIGKLEQVSLANLASNTHHPTLATNSPSSNKKPRIMRGFLLGEAADQRLL